MRHRRREGHPRRGHRRLRRDTEQCRDAAGDSIRILEQLESVHAHVMPAEAPQHLGAQSQRLAEAHRRGDGILRGIRVLLVGIVEVSAERRHPEGRIGVDHQAHPAAGHNQRQFATMPELGTQTVQPQAACQIYEQRIAEGGRMLSARCDRDTIGDPRLDVLEHGCKSHGAVVHARFVDIGRFETGDDIHRTTGSRHSDGEEALTAGPAQSSEVAEHTTVRSATVPDREDDPVAALRHGLIDRGHRERFGAIAEHRIDQFGPTCDRGHHPLLHPHDMRGARRDHHQRLAGCRGGMLHHQFDDLRDLGIDTLDGAGVHIRQPCSSRDQMEAQARVPEEAARPGQRLDPVGVETAVDQFGEIFAAGTVAAGELQRREEPCEPRQGRL